MNIYNKDNNFIYFNKATRNLSTVSLKYNNVEVAEVEGLEYKEKILNNYIFIEKS